MTKLAPPPNAVYLLAQLHVTPQRCGLLRIVISKDRHPSGGPPGTVWAEIARVESDSLMTAKARLSTGFDINIAQLARHAHEFGIVERFY